MQAEHASANTSTQTFVSKLRCHPSSACDAISAASFTIQRRREKILLSYRITGNLSAVLVPELKPAVRANELWRHTCAELFIGVESTREYIEFNLAPSSDWAAYEFVDYRQGMKDLQCEAPHIVTTAAAGSLTIDAQLRLPSTWASKALQAGVSMVVEDRNHQCSYWSITHGDKPDFHQRSHWLCHLPV